MQASKDFSCQSLTSYSCVTFYELNQVLSWQVIHRVNIPMQDRNIPKIHHSSSVTHTVIDEYHTLFWLSDLSLVSYLRTRLSCSLLAASETSSAMIVNIFACFALPRIWSRMWSPRIFTIWFWMPGEVYVVFLAAVTRCSSSSVSPVSILKWRSAQKLPRWFASGFDSTSFRLSRCPWMGMFCRPQSIKVFISDSSRCLFLAIRSVCPWSTWLLMSICFPATIPGTRLLLKLLLCGSRSCAPQFALEPFESFS